jgi:hypothetical protein
MDSRFDPTCYINKIILYQGDLVTVDAVDDVLVYLRKLESDGEVIEASLYWLERDTFSFEEARIKAVNVMNQTRYYDNIVKKEMNNPVT